VSSENSGLDFIWAYPLPSYQDGNTHGLGFSRFTHSYFIKLATALVFLVLREVCLRPHPSEELG